MCFAKKHKKGQKKMQVNNTKALSTCAEAVEAFVKPKGVKPKIPKNGSHKPNQVAYIVHPKLRKSVCAHISKGGSQALPAKGQGQGQGQGPNKDPGCDCSCVCSSGSSSGSGSQRCPGPYKGSGVEASVC
ncbi:PREDICTED: 60S ribosomal protein L29-like [Miniopterus natalensis]|uniref:60S ribosomal protein L29-like n=1 Tax=Miniopterus natalensis TaxID=291302 RepID=UPI0007A71E1F|nr:PREDICTED: 60S ribosomal protein L29-like [Miniopterus natalensis]